MPDDFLLAESHTPSSNSMRPSVDGGHERTRIRWVRPVKIKHNNLMRWLALLAAVLLLIAGVLLPRGDRTEPLKVALGVWPGVETLIVARERGLLPKEQVQLIDMTWPSAASRAFDNGVVDAAVLSLDEVLRLREGGHEPRVVMVMDVSLGADVVLGGKGMNVLADLQGKRVGVDVRSAGMVLLESALESVGLHGGDVDVVPLSPAEVASAMAKQQVDAVVLAEPWATRIRRKGGKVLYDSQQLKVPMYRVLVASAQALKEQRPELRMVMAAHLAMGGALDFAKEASTHEVVLRREGLSLEEFGQTMTRVKLMDRATAARLMQPGGELTAQSAALETWMHEAGLLHGQATTALLMDGSLLKETP